jgi:membrane protein YqaA with SNARE-associated domain
MLPWLAPIDLAAALSPAQFFATTLGVAFVSGFVPFVNIEAYLVAAVVFGGASSSASLAAASAIGQMAAKSLLYFSGRGILRLPFHRHVKRMDEIRDRLTRHAGHSGALLFVSALAGFPPFYVVSILAGALRLPFALFLSTGLLGRFVRFGLFVVFPRLMLRLAR